LNSQGRTLVGYYQTLEEADRSILFSNPAPSTPHIRAVGN
jgi:hypothetical protein